MTAREVKDALRKRHPAYGQGMAGEWVTLEEWRNVDLLALSAWRKATVVGYEVKVSRSDYRSELLKPYKRAEAVAMCHEFYMAVPEGLLKPEEIAYEESLWDDGDFQREKCPDRCVKRAESTRRSRYSPPRGTLSRVPVPVPIVVPDLPSYYDRQEPEQRERYRERHIQEHLHYHGRTQIGCLTCGGKGYVRGSRVEREAPTLWVPRDVGLVTASSRGCKVVKKAPRTYNPEPVARRPQEIHQLARWMSLRPDPRHREAAE